MCLYWEGGVLQEEKEGSDRCFRGWLSGVGSFSARLCGDFGLIITCGNAGEKSFMVLEVNAALNSDN